MKNSKRILYGIVIISTFFLILHVGRFVLRTGFLYYTDVTETTNVNHLIQRYFFTYSDDFGETLADMARIPLFLLLFVVYKIFSIIFVLDLTYFVKIKFVLTIVLGFLVYSICIYKLLKNIKQKEDGMYLVAAIIGGLYYSMNYWISNRLLHFSLFFTTCTLPITFYLMYSFLFNKKTDFRKIAWLSIWLGIFTATPHAVIFEVLIILVLTIVWLIAFKDSLRNIKFKLLGLLALPINFFLINAYWLFPYLKSLSTPDKVLSTYIVDLFSQQSSLINTVRLMTFWLYDNSHYDVFQNSGLTLLASLMPLTLFIIFLVINVTKKKLKYLNISLIILFLVAVFLTNNSSLTDKFYTYIMFKSPLNMFGWLLREYEKIGLLISFVYSVGISFITLEVILHIRKKRSINSGIILIIMLGLLFSHNYLYSKKQLSEYTPDNIITDFYTVNNYLEKEQDVFNTLWYPSGEKPIWTKTHVEEPYVFSNLISAKSSVVVNSQLRNYVTYIMNQTQNDSIQLGKALDYIGVKYLVLRFDDEKHNGEALRIAEILKTNSDLTPVLNTKYLTLYQNNKYTGFSNIYTSDLITNAGLNIFNDASLEKINNKNTFLNFTDKSTSLFPELNSYTNDQKNLETDIKILNETEKLIFPYNYSYEKYEDIPGSWGIGSLENKTHGETDFFLNGKGIKLNQFDYGVGVVIANDGYTLNSNEIRENKKITLTFNEHKNVFLIKDKFLYDTVPQDYDTQWLIIRSEKFPVDNIKAIGAIIENKLPPKYESHFKLTYYDENGNIIMERILNNLVLKKAPAIEKPPAQARTADFSIWTNAQTTKQNGSYTINKLKLLDLSENVENPKINIQEKTQCHGYCHIYLRFLESPKGGKIKIVVNNQNYEIKTYSDIEENGKMVWKKIGSIYINDSNVPAEIDLYNIEGLNAVNALVFLDDEENKLVHTVKNFDDYSGPNYITNPQIEKINPTKYSLKIVQPVSNAVLAIKLPYNKNWKLITPSGEKVDPELINGYINGWYSSYLEPGSYEIRFILQDYFYFGAIISVTFLMITLAYIIKTERNNKTTDHHNPHATPDLLPKPD